MTITFENDNHVIVYGLERIISYARENQYIFLAQSIWWIASVIGLQQGLLIHIENLKNREPIIPDTTSRAISVTRTKCDQKDEGKVHPDRIGQTDNERETSVTPRDLAEDQRLENIHPGRIQQFGKETPDLEEEYDSEPDRQSRALKEADQFLSLSRKERKAFSKKKAKEQLSRTQSGKIITKPLSNKQRQYLQSISKDAIVEYIANRK